MKYSDLPTSHAELHLILAGLDGYINHYKYIDDTCDEIDRVCCIPASARVAERAGDAEMKEQIERILEDYYHRIPWERNRARELLKLEEHQPSMDSFVFHLDLPFDWTPDGEDHFNEAFKRWYVRPLNGEIRGSHIRLVGDPNREILELAKLLRLEVVSAIEARVTPPLDWIVGSRRMLNRALGYKPKYPGKIERLSRDGELTCQPMPNKKIAICMKDPKRHAEVEANMKALSRRRQADG